MTITEFLLERIDDDEWQAKASLGERLPQTWPEEQWSAAVAARVLAECAAKRAIIEMIDNDDSDGWMFPLGLPPILAAIYADHPDYDNEWAM